MLIRIEHVASTDDGLIFKEPISGAVIVLTDAQADAIGLMYNDIHDIIEAAGRLAKAAELPPTQGQALKGQLTIPGLVAASQGPARGQETPLTADAPAPSSPPAPTSQDQHNEEDEWLFGVDVNKEALPYRVNDDAITPPDRMIAIIKTLNEHYDKLDATQMRKAAESIAVIPVHERVKYKDALTDELRNMVVQIILAKDGLKSSLIPAAEAVFLGHGEPDFGLNKQAPPASIPEGFGETALGPNTKYRSAESLSAKLKGTSESTS